MRGYAATISRRSVPDNRRSEAKRGTATSKLTDAYTSTNCPAAAPTTGSAGAVDDRLNQMRNLGGRIMQQRRSDLGR
jgi:hypothetical protein